MNKISVLAIDLGGESGRVIKMDFDGVKFYLEEIHRFPNLPVEASGTTYWDVLSLWREIQSGIAKSSSANSLGVDSWGGGFCLARLSLIGPNSFKKFEWNYFTLIFKN